MSTNLKKLVTARGCDMHGGQFLPPVSLLYLMFVSILISCHNEKDEIEDSNVDLCGDTISPYFAVSWESGGVEVFVRCVGTNYFFGMAETGCSDIESCWFGEDCLYGDSRGGYYYCHPITQSETFLEYGGDPETLLIGYQTVFENQSFENYVTYYFEDSLLDMCWVWGHDPTYYAELGCEYL